MREDDRYADDDWSSAESEAERELPAFLTDPKGVVMRRWPWMLLMGVIGLAATAGVVSQVKPTFAATGKVLITSQQIPEDFVRTTVVEDSLSNVNAMIGRTLSIENLTRLIEGYDLYEDEEGDNSMVDKIETMRENIVIEPADTYGTRDGSLIYEVSFEYREAKKSAAVANALTALMIEASMTQRNQQAQRTTAFLRRALQEDERDLREASRLVAEYRQEHRGMLPTELATNIRRLELLAERRQSLLTQIGEKENQIATIQSSATTDLSENADLLEDLRKQLAQQEAVNTDQHPNVIAVRERIARLEEAVAEEAEHRSENPTVINLVEAERREVALLRAQLDATDKEVALFDERVDGAPKVAEELDALVQKESVLRDSYLTSLRKVDEAEIAESLESAQQGSRVSILDTAQVPSRPKRNRLKFIAAGLVATLGLAGGIALLFELIDPVVVATRQLDSILGRPTIGIMPRIS